MFLSHDRVWLVGAALAAIAVVVYFKSKSAANATDDSGSGVFDDTSDSGDATDNSSTDSTPTDVLSNLGTSIVSTIRGVRNNNPGNIKWSASNQWQGQTGADSGGFCVFDTASNGIRAIAVTLKNYSSHYGLHTVDGIIRRWSSTDQGAYIANVARALDVDPYDSINVDDPDTLYALVKAIITQEDSGAAALAYVVSGSLNSGVALA